MNELAMLSIDRLPYTVRQIRERYPSRRATVSHNQATQIEESNANNQDRNILHTDCFNELAINSSLRNH